MSRWYGYGIFSAVDAAVVSVSVKAAGEVRSTAVRTAVRWHSGRPVVRRNTDTVGPTVGKRRTAGRRNAVGWD